MYDVLYITSSSFSGSTLLAFLLNTHPEIFTVGEMDGWNYAQNETFNCSCGKILSECSFYQGIAEALEQNNLPFSFRNFGTGYCLLENERFNRYLTSALPGAIPSNSLERIRDRMIKSLPFFSKLLRQQDYANLVFIKTGLSYSKASVFVDACKNPHRLRHLSRIKDLRLKVVYLIRDFRGVSLSNINRRNWDADFAARMWIREQLSILRVLDEFPTFIRVYYEDLCNKVDETLEMIHQFLGLKPHCFSGDFKGVEHHILGNVMRLRNVSTIVRDDRWARELSSQELAAIMKVIERFIEKNKANRLTDIIEYFLNRHGNEKLANHSCFGESKGISSSLEH